MQTEAPWGQARFKLHNRGPEWMRGVSPWFTTARDRPANLSDLLTTLRHVYDIGDEKAICLYDVDPRAASDGHHPAQASKWLEEFWLDEHNYPDTFRSNNAHFIQTANFHKFTVFDPDPGQTPHCNQRREQVSAAQKYMMKHQGTVYKETYKDGLPGCYPYRFVDINRNVEEFSQGTVLRKQGLGTNESYQEVTGQ